MITEAELISRLFSIISSNTKYELGIENLQNLETIIIDKIKRKRIGLHNYKSVESMDYNEFIDFCNGQMRLF